MQPNGLFPSKAVLYARVSSKEQERDGYSIPAQCKLLRSYARRHDYQVVREFIDVETAKQPGRIHFTEMIRFLEEHPKVRILLCEKCRFALQAFTIVTARSTCAFSGSGVRLELPRSRGLFSGNKTPIHRAVYPCAVFFVCVDIEKRSRFCNASDSAQRFRFHFLAKGFRIAPSTHSEVIADVIFR